MLLDELALKVEEALRIVKAHGVNPKDVAVLVDTEEDADLEIDSLTAEEFPDDEETYREHVRKGGKREFSVHISVS